MSAYLKRLFAKFPGFTARPASSTRDTMLKHELLERATTAILDRKLARTASAIEELEESLLLSRANERKATRIYHDLKGS